MFAHRPVLDEYHRDGAQRQIDDGGALFLRSDDAIDRYDGNHVRRIRLEDETAVDGFFRRVDDFSSYVPYRAVRIDPLTVPAAVEARLLQDDYRHSTEVVLVAPVGLSGKPAEAEIVPIEDEAGWRSLQRLKAADLAREASAVEAMSLVRRRQTFTWFLALVNGVPVGNF